MAKPELLKSLRSCVQNRVDPELLDEAAQFTLRGRTLHQVNKMRLHTPLGEEAQSLSSVGALSHSKDLNFHRFQKPSSECANRSALYQLGTWRPLHDDKISRCLVASGSSRANAMGETRSPRAGTTNDWRALENTGRRFSRYS